MHKKLANIKNAFILISQYTVLCIAEAVNSLMKAIEVYTDMGKFTMAAKHHQSIAEIYETEVCLIFLFLLILQIFGGKLCN